MIESDGRAIMLERGGVAVAISPLGATLTSIRTPDRHGKSAEILLGWRDPLAYGSAAYRQANPYFGATIGRYGNRIAGATFAIDGVEYPLSRNDGRHHLHGGRDGFDRRLWAARELHDSVRLSLVSPAGDQGFPGTLAVTARFKLSDSALAITYTATCDQPTHVNLVIHPYFNLAAHHGSIADHRLTIHADFFLPIDGDGIPTGEIAPVYGPFDFRRARRIGDTLASDDAQLRIGDGFNHCFVVRRNPGRLRRAATLREPDSGRVVEVLTDQPGLQFYSANALDGSLYGDDGRAFARRAGICLEPQHYPDSPNRPAFPSTLLRPGERYRSRTVLRFSIR